MQPLFRWPGGKRWLAPALASIAQLVTVERYVEPFAGGAAGFFAISPCSALLADSNSELIASYRAISEHPALVHAALLKLPSGPDGYLVVRASRPTTDDAIAARFLYLRANAFGGLYRVNQRGEFNVPYGGQRRREPLSFEEVAGASAALQGAVFADQSFEETFKEARCADLIYLDPPYPSAASGRESFGRYTDTSFTLDQHRHLAKLATDFARSGGYIMASNAYTSDALSLYPRDVFHCFRLQRSSTVSPTTARRTVVSELLAVSKSFPRRRASLRARLGGVVGQ